MNAEPHPAKAKPKGILKKATTAPPSSSSPPDSPPQPTPELTRQEQLAQQETLARIRLLQQLRDTELKPPVALETFELLCDLPKTTPPPPASSPSASDTSLFLTTLRDFQPSEYLDLIEERNCLGKCGYTLCPRPRRTREGEYALASGIARTADLNKWCSDACATRALFLKVQLDNPSYERRDGKMVVKLELREEKNKAKTAGEKTATATPRGEEHDRNRLAQEMAQLQIDQQKKGKRNALAAERGERGLFASQGKVEVTIREKTTDEVAQPPSLEEDRHLLVEGYKPIFGTDQKLGDNPGSDDDDDDDDPFPTIRL